MHPETGGLQRAEGQRAGARLRPLGRRRLRAAVHGALARARGARQARRRARPRAHARRRDRGRRPSPARARRRRQCARASRRLRPFPRAGMTAAQPGASFAFSHPAHVVALGAGAGLTPVAPGTAGTLAAWPLGWLIGAYLPPLLFLALTALLFL